MDTPEVIEQTPPESNQEQFQRWVHYVDTDLWPAIVELEARCRALYDGILQQRRTLTASELAEKEKEFESIGDYSDALLRGADQIGQTFSDSLYKGFIVHLGHYVNPRMNLVRLLIDKADEDLTGLPSYDSQSRKDWATKEGLIRAGKEFLEV